MNIEIVCVGAESAGEVAALYSAVCEQLDKGINYPHWVKGVYPSYSTALEAALEGSLYVARYEGRIVGSVILRHRGEEGYDNIAWRTVSDYSRILVVYALAVHPDYLRMGVGRELLRYAETFARLEGDVCLRLDVVSGNVPAEALYRSCGYEFAASASLGYEKYGIPLFNMYEKGLSES